MLVSDFISEKFRRADMRHLRWVDDFESGRQLKHLLGVYPSFIHMGIIAAGVGDHDRYYSQNPSYWDTRIRDAGMPLTNDWFAAIIGGLPIVMCKSQEDLVTMRLLGILAPESNHASNSK